jgi:hypothetical protein
LRKLEVEAKKSQRELLSKYGRRADLRGAVTLVYASTPKGVSAAEWHAAVQHDQTLQNASSLLSRR